MRLHKWKFSNCKKYRLINKFTESWDAKNYIKMKVSGHLAQDFLNSLFYLTILVFTFICILSLLIQLLSIF
ncbi:unnamed protein product [Blepharisma stoltei]|uniref:Uncharacterized protein n=1 Tax=Blepharisma stoltei TaxID=1481888 RepID=A0AAU9I9P6_9CILI|nr:unnamed protein product [Blepharisma stoltei]